MRSLDDRAIRNLLDLVVEAEHDDVIDGRFELGQRIGEGGMGTVYAAVDRVTGSEVAVKLVRLDAQHDEARFAREAETLARCGHSAVVSYVAHGMHAGRAYLVMDRLRGATLAARLARSSSALSLRDGVAIVRRLADGLAAVHAAGITHRDVKPSNVFLVDDSPERPRLLDFGLARLAHAATLTRKGSLVGTPGYMAPEQVRGERAGPSADVFALGCILYECVAKRAAFAAEGTELLYAQILLEQPTSLDVVARDVPRALVDLTARMLDKDPARRPAADEIARALEVLALERAASTPAAIAPGIVRGQVLAGKYCVERLLGEGGMGSVVAAKHIELGSRVAIKLMRSSDRADHARFVREAQAVARIESEHVARVLDVGRTDDGTPYIIMEHLNGVDLSRYLREHGPLPIAKAVDYVLEACEAIAEAHVLGIVHRDLKPSNLFLAARRDGSELVKVLDFGISKMTRALEDVSNDMTVTDAKVVLGSIAYMSPEQLQGSASVDARSDVWALGIVLYELLTKARPFDGESPALVGARIAAARPPRLREHRPEAPAAIESAILRCLQEDPSARFQDVAELARALAPHGSETSRSAVGRVVRLLEGASDSATAAPRVSRRRSRQVSTRLTVLGLAAFVGGIAAVSAVVLETTIPVASFVSSSGSDAAAAPPLVASASATPASASSPKAVASSTERESTEPITSSLPTRPAAPTANAVAAPRARPQPAVASSAPSAPSARGALDLRDPALSSR